jgi:DHA2 family multidrug resistance protein-like MFS transporter
VTVARGLPGPLAGELLASARAAFDSGVGVTAVIGAALVASAAVVALVTLRRVRS